MKRLIAQSNNGSDECYTPLVALNPLLPFLKQEWRVWECAQGTGELVKHLESLGFKVQGGSSFFEEIFDCDVIITNPPYSLKTEFLEHAFKLNKPFAFLLPLTALEGKKRSQLFAKHGIQLIIPNKRINFMTGSGKNNVWFQTAWFTHGLNLPRDLNFVELEIS